MHVPMDTDPGPHPTREIRSHRAKWIVLLLVVVAVVSSIYWLRETDSERSLTGNAAKLQPLNGEHGSRATGGTLGTASAATDAAELSQIQEIVDAENPDQLIGKRITLQLPSGDRANDVVFWIGPVGNRVLVAMRRDHRDSAQRTHGTEPGHGIRQVSAGEPVTIEGTIQEVPKGEDMYSWQLSAQERKELASRGIYIHADAIQ